MSLFRYRVSVTGGKKVSGLITGKTEKAARELLAKRLLIVEWHSMEEEPQMQPVAPATVQKPKPQSKLGKMLYLQLGRCFFCGEPLPEAEASIEHLNPKSKGGLSTEDNEVVCHASLNETFGNMDLKRKFEFTLKVAGRFKCPKG